MKMNRLLLMAFLAALVRGRTVGPNYQRPAISVPTPGVSR